MAGLLDGYGQALGGLLNSYGGLFGNVGAAMPEAYGANAPIMDPIAKGVISAATLPKRAIDASANMVSTGQYDAPTFLEAAALPMMGAMPFAQKGAAGIFGGRLAETADLQALARAEKMQSQGAAREAIWKDTGWFQGSDGKWRFEISDRDAKMNPNKYDVMPTQESGLIAGQFWHPDLYKAYPDLRNIQATVKGTENTVGGHHGRGLLNEEIEVRSPTADYARSVILHELQHAVQAREGFPMGGQNIAPGYLSLPGEIEARVVQGRRNLTTDARRAIPPWVDEAVEQELARKRK